MDKNKTNFKFSKQIIPKTCDLSKSSSCNSIHYSIDQNEVLAKVNFGIYVKYMNEWVRHRRADKITYYILLNGKGTFNGFIEVQNISQRTNKYKELKMTFKKIQASEAEQHELAKVTNFIPTKKQMAGVKAKLMTVTDDDSVATGLKCKSNFDNIE
ncbi:hypothetical protein GLOIN_2v1627706 [Rhizophagus clarus]|uniref:Uncharacterized protein n=1 Tax=Rhizophagus clarus TaxID=94130 RepID=A0A8H3QK18_9GLOM|nr:hypothetical protein GLOIN_2v1627706 [Rhizophagus clarus]